MKRGVTLFSLLVLTSCVITAQTVTIGKQVWMTKNLNVSSFRNGDPIPEAKTEGEWKAYSQAKEPAWCYYDNDSSNGEKYGKLYNWYAVKDKRGLAPAGYHIPTDKEWTVLTNYLGGVEIAGAKMKSSQGWGVKDGNGTNSSGFSGLPGGDRRDDGSFLGIGNYGGWWSSSEGSAGNAWCRTLGWHSGGVGRSDFGKVYGKVIGWSVRCLRD